MHVSEIITKTVQVHDLPITYYQAGTSGSPLVLLHGGGVDSALISWGDMLPELAKNHVVIAPDLPGYGASAVPDINYTQEFYLNFLEDFLNALGLENVHLAGLSLGGGIALGYALDHPQRVQKLILVDSYGIVSFEPYHRLMALYIRTPLNEFSYWCLKQNRNWIRLSLSAAIYDPANITEELLDQVVAAIRTKTAGIAFRSFQRSEMLWSGVRSDYTGRLKDLTTPTLILHGDQDITLLPIWAEKAHQAIRNSRLVMLKNRKHWSLRDKPEEIVAIMLDFLAEPPQ